MENNYTLKEICKLSHLTSNNNLITTKKTKNKIIKITTLWEIKTVITIKEIMMIVVIITINKIDINKVLIM